MKLRTRTILVAVAFLALALAVGILTARLAERDRMILDLLGENAEFAEDLDAERRARAEEKLEADETINYLEAEILQGRSRKETSPLQTR